MWEPINNPTPAQSSLGNDIEQVLSNFEQIFENVEPTAPSVENSFLPQNIETRTGENLVESAQENKVEESVQMGYKAIWAKIDNSRGERSVMKSSLGVAKSLLGLSRSGSIRNFLFNLAGPV